MLGNRHLPLLILIALVFIVCTIGPIKKAIGEHSPMAKVCQNAISSAFGDGWEYDYIVSSSDSPFLENSFPRPITVVFGDGVNTLWCHVRHNGSEWEVDDLSAPPEWMYP